MSHCLVRTQTAAQLSTLKRWCSFIQAKSSSVGPKLSIASIDARCHSETWPWRFTNFPSFCNSKGTALSSAVVKIHTRHIYFDVGHFTLGSWQQLEKLEKKEMSSKKKKKLEDGFQEKPHKTQVKKTTTNNRETFKKHCECIYTGRHVKTLL